MKLVFENILQYSINSLSDIDKQKLNNGCSHVWEYYGQFECNEGDTIDKFVCIRCGTVVRRDWQLGIRNAKIIVSTQNEETIREIIE